MSDRRRPDLLARLVGMLTFLAGLLVIAVVLKLAYGLFLDPTMGRGTEVASAGDPLWATMLRSFGALLLRVLLLLLGSISGSLIANKGMRLYVGALEAQRDPTDAEPN